MSKILLTICARGGSKGVKGKNIKDLNGKPLIYYTIKQALKWDKAKRVIVTTDSEEIAKIAKKYGAQVPFKRPAELATDTAGTISVLRHAIQECESIYKEKYDYLIDLPVTAPIRTSKDIDEALKLFKKKKPETLVSVTPAARNPYFNMLEDSGNGKVWYSKPNDGFLRRQDAPSVYDMNNSIYIYDINYLKDEKNTKAVSKNTVPFIMDPISAIDIDTEIDFKILESLVKERIVKL